MSYIINDGIIVSCEKIPSVANSKIKSSINIADMVFVLPSEGESVDYGVFLGKMTSAPERENCIVRNVSGDFLCQYHKIISIEPSESMLDMFVESISKDINSNSGISQRRREATKFLYQYVCWKFPDKASAIDIPRCVECGSAFPDNITDSGAICADCFDKKFSECHICHGVFRKDTMVDEECPQCFQRHRVLPWKREQPRLRFYDTEHIDGTYQPKQTDVPYMGVELEVAYGGVSDKTVRTTLPLINNDKNCFLYCTTDSSLDDGLEFITQPATLRHHQSIADNYKSVFKNLRDLGYRSHDTACCGMHVHFNRSFYGNKHDACVSKLLYLFEKFWNEMMIFSRRTEYHVLRWSKPFDMSIADYISEKDRAGDHADHYYALNISNSQTIEFRIFRGTLNLSSFLATLELVNNFVVFSKEKTNEELQAMRFSDMLTTPALVNYYNRVSSTDPEQ